MTASTLPIAILGGMWFFLEFRRSMTMPDEEFKKISDKEHFKKLVPGAVLFVSGIVLWALWQ